MYYMVTFSSRELKCVLRVKGKAVADSKSALQISPYVLHLFQFSLVVKLETVSWSRLGNYICQFNPLSNSTSILNVTDYNSNNTIILRNSDI